MRAGSSGRSLGSGGQGSGSSVCVSVMRVGSPAMGNCGRLCNACESGHAEGRSLQGADEVDVTSSCRAGDVLLAAAQCFSLRATSTQSSSMFSPHGNVAPCAENYIQPAEDRVPLPSTDVPVPSTALPCQARRSLAKHGRSPAKHGVPLPSTDAPLPSTDVPVPSTAPGSPAALRGERSATSFHYFFRCTRTAEPISRPSTAPRYA
jgi:hypothetical protein